MAEPSDDAVSPLMPSLSKSHFPSNDAVLVDKENAPTDQNGLNNTEFCLSSTCLVFPNEFDSLDSASSSPSASSLGSTETDNTSDEEDFLAGLTQRLTHSSTRKIEKSWVASGSPQSTLSGLGSTSWSSNGSSSSLVPSPPTTPFGCEDDKRDLISAAADQIARLKMLNTTEPETAPSYTITNSDARGGLLLAPPRGSSPFHLAKNPDSVFYNRHSVVSLDLGPNTYHYQEYMKHEEVLKAQSLMRPRTWATSQPHQMYDRTRSNYVCEGVRCGRRQQQQQLDFQAAWAPSQKPQQQRRPIFVAGSGNVKRGTGVFLPRRYGNSNPHDELRRSGSPRVLSSTINNNNNNNGLLQQGFNCCFDPKYDAMMMARRNAVISLQRRNIREEGGRNHEIHLPKEWTY